MKLVLVFGPLVLYLVALAARVALGRAPLRHALNVEVSVVLVLYFLVTAGLGIFWVANQQLPAFDLHYLFGYATVALVAAHLVFNLRIVARHFAKRSGAAAANPRASTVRRGLLFALAVAIAFFVGRRAGTTELRVGAGDTPDPSREAVLAYHAFSSHAREGVVGRAPSVSWGEDVPRAIDRSSLATTTLPGVDAAPRSPEGTVSIDDVAAIAFAAAGITERRGGHDLRAAASSGALFPTEVYVIALDVAGLPSGAYAYVPDGHALARVGDGMDLANVGLPEVAVARPAAVVVFTSVFRRTGQKYRDRAYRYAIADGGHSLGNALEAARDRDLAARIAPRFDESAVARAIGVDDVEEGVIAMVAVARTAAASGDAAPGALAAAPLDDVAELALGATSLAHLATSLRVVTRRAAATGRIELPAPAAGDRAPALPILRARRSVRSFDDRPLTMEELAVVLDRALGSPPLVSRAVRAHVVANRVDGLAKGAYAFDPAARSLAPSREGDLAAAAGRAALDQEAVGGAAAVVILSFDRATLATEGARGYRQAFLEAGIIGARLYIGAAEAKLGGTAVGAFYDGEAEALVGVGDREWVAHFFALGAPE